MVTASRIRVDDTAAPFPVWRDRLAQVPSIDPPRRALVAFSEHTADHETTESEVQHRPERPLTWNRMTSTRWPTTSPVSSNLSRTAASSGVSPYSTIPPGNALLPA